MRRWIILFAFFFLSIPAAMAAQGSGKPDSACAQQFEQCNKQCDKRKALWFFKGEAYKTCADKCVARREACIASGQGMTDKAKEAQGQMDDGSKSMEHEKKVKDGAMDREREMEGEHDQDRDKAKERMEDKASAMEKEGKGAREMKDTAKEKMDKAKEKKGKNDNGGKSQGDDDDSGD
jgi:hypothetical protein